MSSIWRIFKVKSSKNTLVTIPESRDNGGEEGGDEWEDAPPNLDRARCRGDRMSVSRSGRFKQKQRRRSALFDNPDLVGRKGVPPDTPAPDYENDENSMQRANGDAKDRPWSAVSSRDTSKCTSPQVQVAG